MNLSDISIQDAKYWEQKAYVTRQYEGYALHFKSGTVTMYDTFEKAFTFFESNDRINNKPTAYKIMDKNGELLEFTDMFENRLNENKSPKAVQSKRTWMEKLFDYFS